MKKSLLKDIIRRCRDEINSHPQKEYFMHWSMIIQNNQIIADGVNRDMEPPKCFGYHKPELVEIGFKPKIHSEFSAVSRCKRAIYGSEVVNVRLNKNGEPRMSMPCKACRSLLKTVNCRKVWFTCESGWGSLEL